MSKYACSIVFFTLLLTNSLISQTIVMVGPCGFTVEAVITRPTCPEGNDGAIVLNVSGANGNVTYEWLDANNPPQPATIGFRENLAQGNYKVAIQDEVCLDTFYIDVTDPEPAVDFFLNTLNVSCNGETDAMITVESNNDGTIDSYNLNNGVTGQTSNVFDGLGPGEYIVNVTDINGCSYEAMTLVEQPDSIQMFVNTAPASCEESQDGTIMVDAQGGVGDFKYSIDGTAFQEENIFIHLSAGDYTIYTKDGNECITYSTAFVETEEPPTLNFETEPVSCPGGTNGVLIVIIESVSQQENYTYSLNGGDFQQDSIFTNLDGGTYEVAIQNNVGCVTTATVMVEEPTEPIIDYIPGEVSCPGGTDGVLIVIIESVSNTEDFEYSIDGINYQPDSIFTNLGAGSYDIHIRNSNNCEFILNGMVTEPTPPETGFDITDVSCPGGTDGVLIVIIESVSGNGDLDFSLDGINYQPDSIFTGLSAGVYQVFIRNGNNCVFTETVTIGSPTPPQLQIITTPVTCFAGQDGVIELQINDPGNMGPFEFSLDGMNFQTSSVFNTLAAGDYTITIRNNNNCTASKTTRIDEGISINLSLEKATATCGISNGWINSAVSGGTAPYTYFWSNGGTESGIQNLPGGSYVVTVADQAGCQTILFTEIEQIEAPSIEVDILEASCFDSNDGAIDVEVSGVAIPFKYNWSNGTSKQDLDFISKGNYTLTVTDNNNCTVVETYEVTAPDTLKVNGSIEQKGNLGNISTQVSGGTAPYNYQWSNGNGNAGLREVSPGMYYVTIEDANRCIALAEYEIEPVKGPMEDHIHLYPNPTFERIVLDIRLPASNEVQYRLIDELGRELLYSPLENITSKRIVLDLDQLAAAVYYLYLEVGEERLVKRIVKIKE